MVADLTHRERTFGACEYADDLGLRGGEAERTQQRGQRAVAIALDGKDEIAQLFCRFHADKPIDT
jgi:hypothetical protein